MHDGYLACALDLLNVRDLDLVAQAGAHCDRLTLGVLTDDDIVAATGRPPVIALEERLILASHLRGVERAVIHHEAEYELLPDDTVVMAVEGESDWLRPDADLVLTPRVVSAATLLRAAVGAVEVVA